MRPLTPPCLMALGVGVVLVEYSLASMVRHEEEGHQSAKTRRGSDQRP
jgi:hypothetical protein